MKMAFPLGHWSRIRDHLLVRWWNFAGPRLLTAAGVELGADVRFYGLPIVGKAPTSTIQVGARSVLCSSSRFTALSVAKPVTMRTLRPGAVIRIGEDCGLSGTVICAANSVHIGDQCLIGADVHIVDTDFHPIDPSRRRFTSDPAFVASAPIHIGRNVFLGAGVVVLKGVTIGDDAVVGAASVVTRAVPAGAIAAGNPARVVGNVSRAIAT